MTKSGFSQTSVNEADAHPLTVDMQRLGSVS